MALLFFSLLASVGSLLLSLSLFLNYLVECCLSLVHRAAAISRPLSYVSIVPDDHRIFRSMEVWRELIYIGYWVVLKFSESLSHSYQYYTFIGRGWR